MSKTTGAAAITFYWDGDALLSDYVSDSEAEPNSRYREWIYYPETFEPLAMLHSNTVDSNEIFLYHNDPNGCPNRLMDQVGKIVWMARYTAWGGVEELLVNEVDNPIRLQGQYWDGETGLAYNRYRYFVSSIGQFASEDPIGLKGGINTYEYAPNVPSWIDPFGLAYQATKKAKKEIQEGIYEFTDTQGKKYVGQSSNISKRLKQHVKLDKLDPNEKVKVTEVLGGKTTREIAEHKRIQQLTGGVPARRSNKVSNKVDPIGAKRRHLLD